MISRVNAPGMAQTAMRHLQANLSQLARLQEQATSTRAFAAPSENPNGTATVLGLHADQRRNTQYARNIDDGIAWVTTVDSAITASTSLLSRVRNLTVQGANDGSMSPTAKEAIAVELEGLRDSLLTQANSTVAGRTVFAGTSDAGAAFAPDYSFNGVAGSEVTRRVSDSATVRVDADGAEVFGVGNDSVFALVDRIIADLRGGVNVGTHLSAIDDRRTAMLGAQGAVGARQNQLERAKEATVGESVSLEARRSAVENVDSVEVLVRLQSQELVYRSALAVTGRVLQPSLMDFLK